MPMSNVGIIFSFNGGGALDDSWNWQPDVTPNTEKIADSKIISLETRVVEVNYPGTKAVANMQGRMGHRSSLIRR